MGISLRRLQWLEVHPILKRAHRGMELHHVFGRIGRALACQRFIEPLSPDAHRGPGYGKLTVELRDKHRTAISEMATANAQNMDVCSCWWKECEFAGDACPLSRRAHTLDSRELSALS